MTAFRTITSEDWRTALRNARIRREHRDAFRRAYITLVTQELSPAVAATGTTSARQTSIGVCDATAGETNFGGRNE
jgi:hypothetical protein